jgi:8-oxo-dGTP pyrophosphatase MutT (NUDIX family)
MKEDEAQKLNVVKYLSWKKPKTFDLRKLCKRSGVTQLQLRQALAKLAAEQRGYLELVDRWSGRPTGRVARWDVVHNAGRWHASVAVIVADSQGRIALQSRGESDSYGKWDISVAGHLDVGESDIQAAVRETREELQLDVESKMLMRLGKPYQYWKVGDRKIARDKHESANGYVYWKKNGNQERISLFLVKISEEMKKQIRSFGENAALSIEWKTPREANKLASMEPENCASSLKQFFTSTEILNHIGKKLLQAVH